MARDVVPAVIDYCRANKNTFPKGDIRFAVNVFALDRAVTMFGKDAAKNGLNMSFDKASVAIVNAAASEDSSLSDLLSNAQREATRVIVGVLDNNKCVAA